MKRKLNKRAVALLVCLAVLLTVVAGATLAILITGTEQLKNIFTPAKVMVEVQEGTLTGQTLSDVTVKNTGNTSAFIRVALVVTWKDDAGNIWIEQPQHTLTGGTNWKQIGNFLYYTDSVSAGNATDALPTIQVTSAAPDGYSLSIEVLASGIQSTPETVVKNEWNVQVTAGKITG